MTATAAIIVRAVPTRFTRMFFTLPKTQHLNRRKLQLAHLELPHLTLSA